MRVCGAGRAAPGRSVDFQCGIDGEDQRPLSLDAGDEVVVQACLDHVRGETAVSKFAFDELAVVRIGAQQQDLRRPRVGSLEVQDGSPVRKIRNSDCPATPPRRAVIFRRARCQVRKAGRYWTTLTS